MWLPLIKELSLLDHTLKCPSSPAFYYQLRPIRSLGFLEYQRTWGRGGSNFFHHHHDITSGLLTTSGGSRRHSKKWFWVLKKFENHHSKRSVPEWVSLLLLCSITMLLQHYPWMLGKTFRLLSSFLCEDQICDSTHYRETWSRFAKANLNVVVLILEKVWHIKQCKQTKF